MSEQKRPRPTPSPPQGRPLPADNTLSEPSVLLAAGAKLANGEDRVFYIEGVPHMLIPDGMQLLDRSDLLEGPRRIEENIILGDRSDFVQYFRRFAGAKPEAAVCFYTTGADGGGVSGILDYHTPGVPNWGRHRVELALPFTESYQAWFGAHNRWYGQLDFGEFLDENGEDIIDEQAGVLQAAALGFSAKKITEFKSATRLDNGAIQVAFNEDIRQDSQAGAIQLPEEFYLGLAVFENEDTFKIRCKLRYRLREGDLKLGFVIHRGRLVRQAAVERLIAKLREELPQTPFYSALPR